MSPDDQAVASANAATGSTPATPAGVRAFAVAAGTVVYFVIWLPLEWGLALMLGAGTDVSHIVQTLAVWWIGTFLVGAGAFVAAFATAKLLAPDVMVGRLTKAVGWPLGIGLVLSILGAVLALVNASNPFWYFCVALVFMFILGLAGVGSASKWLRANF